MSYVSGDQAITNDLQIYMANGRPLPRIWVSLVVRIRREFITSSSTLLYAHVTVYAHCIVPHSVSFCVAGHFSGPDVAIGPD